MTPRRPIRPAGRAFVGLVVAVALLVPFVPASLAATPSGTVSGVLAIDGALTTKAVSVITIIDQGAAADEGIVIGQQRLPGAGAGSIPFSVPYDPARIDSARPYVLYASIVDGGAVLQSTAPVPVITGGAESGLTVPMALRPSGPATLTVQVTKKDKTALSASAVVQAAVVKTGSGRVASRDISVTPGQAPVSLAIPYDPALVDPAATYVAKAVIVDGSAVWESLGSVTIDPASTTGSITIDVTKLPEQLPVATPTPKPTATPKPTTAPTATPKPTTAPTATPKPTTAPTATPKPTTAPTATPKPTTAPTATPKPTEPPTAAPTPSPSPTPTPTASPSPTPTPTASPSPTPKPTPKPTATPGPASGTVTGTLVYREPAKLSAAAEAIIALVDEGNGSSVAVLASQVITNPGQQPIAFSVDYKTADVDPAKTYTIRGAVVDGDNAWVSATGVPVITEGAPVSGVVVPLTYRPDLLVGEVTGTLTRIDGTLGDGAASVTMVVQPDTGAVLGFDARPLPGASAPIPFSVTFNVAEVDPNATYVVTSEVTDGDRTWESVQPPAVITDGNPLTGVTVSMTAAATPTPTPSPTPTPAPAVTPAPTPEPGGGTGGDGSPPWLLLFVVAAVVVGGIAAFLYARRNATPPPAGTPTAGGPSTDPAAAGEPDAAAAAGEPDAAAAAGEPDAAPSAGEPAAADAPGEVAADAVPAPESVTGAAGVTDTPGGDTAASAAAATGAPAMTDPPAATGAPAAADTAADVEPPPGG
jgi:uncharacterized lipoprotein YbaY